jgi:cell wall-associated NlpC family hydrolase
MKRLLIAGVIALTLTACTSTSSKVSADTLTQPVQLNSNNALEKRSSVPFVLTQMVTKLTLLQQQQRKAQQLENNKIQIVKAVKKVKKYKGKTWYVFSGSSPSGWDCSGLVRWTYEQMGVTLEHSATKQMRSGTVVKKPVVGDIVAFYHGNGRYSFHVGLYIGNGKMIHAYRPGTSTRIDAIADVAKGNWSKYKFIRILEQPKPVPDNERTIGSLAKVEQPSAA